MASSDVFHFNTAMWRSALIVMHTIAKEEAIENGVAFVLAQREGDDFPRVAFRVLGNIERDPDSSRGADDTGTNYFAVAMSKLADMMSSHTDSGHLKRPLKFGEVPYRGGLIKKVEGGFLYTGFSGGTEDQDVAIAKKGMNTLLGVQVP